MLSVRYIAIDRNFPHHLNCFDNVPVNYANGALVNVSLPSTSQTFYRNVINYTLQAQSSGFTRVTFSNPISKNIVLLFMSAVNL